MVSDMLLVWCFWLSTGKRRFIKLDLVTAGQFLFHFSRVLGSVVDCVNVNPARAWHLNHALRDAQNVCALTKVGTVLNKSWLQFFSRVTFSRIALIIFNLLRLTTKGET